MCVCVSVCVCVCVRVGKNAGLVIERLRVRIPAGAAGEFSSPDSTLCADSFILCPFHPRVIAVARKRPRSFYQKCRWQVTPKHAYTQRSRSGLNSCCQGIVWEPIRKRAYTLLVRKNIGHSRLSPPSNCGLILALVE